MSDNLKKCIKDFRTCIQYKGEPRNYKAMIKYLSHKKCVYNAMREISMNIINKKIKLNSKQRKKLAPYAKTIKRLKCGVKCKLHKRRLVQQTGGFLPWLLPLVATAITTAIDLAKK
jgi:hypothetical protein